MDKTEFKRRTKRYGLQVIKLVQSLSEDRVARVMSNQLLRAATSVGANYRAACRAKSKADFVNKLKIVEEECDESLYWMELLIEAGLVPKGKLDPVMQEGDEILAITVASIKRVRASSDS